LKRAELYRGFWWADLSEGGHLLDLDVNGKIILKLIFKNWNEKTWSRLIWLRIETGVGRFGCGNKHLGYIK
jgi:hypothetical protein